MTDAEKEEIRQYNGRMLEELCELGEMVVHNYLPEGWTQSRWDKALAEHRKHGEE